MRSFSLLFVLGACLAPGLSLEHRVLGSTDTSDKVESDLVERDGEFFAAQRPLARPDDNVDEQNSIDLNRNIVDDPVNTIEFSAKQDSRSEDNHPDTHSILKRVPGFVTFTQRIFTRVGVTTTVNISTPITQRTGGLVTVTAGSDDLRTVTSLAGSLQTVTQFITESGTVYQLTIPPPGATEEFLTSAFVVETLGTTLTVRRGQLVPFTTFLPGTETVTVGISFVTVTSTVFITRTVQATVFVPVATTALVLPGDCACPEPTTTADSQ